MEKQSENSTQPYPTMVQPWVLSHWAHLTVLRFIFVYVLYACVGL